MEILIQNLKALTGLDRRDVVFFADFFQICEVPNKRLLLSLGATCQTLWFIDTGCLRAYYNIEERKRIGPAKKNETVTREVTNWIAMEGGFLTDINSFCFQVPSSYNIEAIEPAKLYALSYDKYLTMQKMCPEISQKLLEHTLSMADKRMRLCNLRDPEERLQMFEHLIPSLKGRLSVNIQASYLNIDPATLSRIRGKFQK
jgi:CRP-like cAMP-binding protein